MKKYLTLLLLLPCFSLFADGGGDYARGSNINVMDNTSNIFYTSVEGEIKFKNDKGKDEVRKSVSNIALYHISDQKTTLLFPENLNEEIHEFYFESSYFEAGKMIIFNDSPGEYGSRCLIGNYDVPQRPVSNKLFVFTYNYDTKLYSLWISDKTGKDLQRVYQCNYKSHYYFDVKNQIVRFVQQVGSKIEIKDIKY